MCDTMQVYTKKKAGWRVKYGQVIRARFLARPNRFIAHAALENGETAVCHVKNTGRCRELLVPGAAVYLERAANPGRKTAYDLIAVEKGTRLINMDAQAPNRVFGEWARTFEPSVETVKPEFPFGQSRLDFCLTGPQGLHLVEVKGVTLEDGGHARFPDAPTDVAPNDATPPALGAARRQPAAAGVRVAAYSCRVTPDSMTIHRSVPVVL